MLENIHIFFLMYRGSQFVENTRLAKYHKIIPFITEIGTQHLLSQHVTNYLHAV